jgi:hypothetical protein
MDNLLKKVINVSLSLRKQKLPLIYKILYPFTWAIVVLAFIAGTFLLISDLFPVHLSHMPLSAAPLLLIGTAYLAFQVLIRAQFLDLCKALIVSSAFILWGIDQLLPLGWFATTLGDIVIVLYVIDLGWMMMDRLKQQWQSCYAQSGSQSMRGNAGRGVTLRAPMSPKALLLAGVRTQGDAPTRVFKQYMPQRSAASQTGNASSLKQNRLKPLSCTCTSPLSPLQSSACCCQMKDASGIKG